MATYDAGTIKATVDANTRPFTSAMLRAAATNRAATRSISNDSNRASQSVAGLTGNAKILTRQFGALGVAASALIVPGIASLVRPAAGAIDALGGSAVIAAKSLTDLQGAVVALPIGLSALAQGFGAVKFATMGLGDAVKAFAEGDAEAIKEALKGTSEEAGQFAKALVGLRPEIEKIRDAAAKELFPGLTDGLTEAARNLPVLKNAMAGTASVMGDLAREVGQFVGSDTFGSRFATITERNTALLWTAGNAAIDLADAFTLLLVKAKPLTDFMGELIGDLGQWAKASVEVAAANGDLTRYFQRTVDSFRDWGSIIVNTAGFLRELFAGAAGPAEEFRNWLVDTTNGWKEWSRSAEGAQAIGDFFDRITPTLKATGALFGDLIKAIWDLGNTDAAQQSFIAFAEQLRTGLLPALEEMAKGVGPEMAANLVKLAEAIARVLNIASFNPILTMVGAISDLAIAVTKLIGLVPGLGDLLGILSLMFVASKIAQIAQFQAAITGLSKAFTLLKAPVMAAAAAMGVYGAASTKVALTEQARGWSQLFAAAKPVPGITQSAAGAMSKLTPAARAAGAATSALAAGGAAVAGAWPVAAVIIGYTLVQSLMDAAAAADRFRTQWESMVDEMAVGEFQNASKMLRQMGNDIDDNAKKIEDFSGGDLARMWFGDVTKWKEWWNGLQAAIANEGWWGTLTFWDNEDSTGLRAAHEEMLAERERFQNTWLQLNSDFEKALGAQGGQQKWFEAQSISMKQFEQLAVDAGVNVERLANLTGDKYATAMANATEKVTEYYNTQIAADESTKTFYNSMMTLNDKLATNAEKATAARDALFALNDGLVDGEREAISYAAKLDEVRTQLSKNNFVLNKQGNALKHNTNRTREGATAMLDMRDAALEQATAGVAQTQATRGTNAAIKRLTSQYEIQYDKLVKVYTQMGFNRKQAREMVNAYMRTPKQVKTMFETPGILQRIREGESLKSIMRDLNGAKARPDVKVEGEQEAKGVIGRISSAVKNFVSKQYRASVTVVGAVDPSSDQYLFRKANGASIPLGSIQAYATGGQVLGPGTGTSDSIPAWLSKGEFVISAAAVRKYGSEMFAALNTQKFAAGGLAGGGVVVGASDTKAYHEALKSLFEKLLKGLKGEDHAREKANKQMERILKQSNRSLERSLNQMVKSLEQQAKAALKAAQQAFTQRVASIKQGIQGFGAVTQTGGTEYVSGQGLLEEMKARKQAAANFANLYDQLKGLGLNKRSLREIVAAGPQEGAKIAEALLDGGRKATQARIDEINRLENQITKIGREFGTTVAVDEGMRKDIREARANLQAIQSTEITVSEGAVKVAIDLSGVDKQDRQKIKDTVDRSVNRAFKEFIRELRRNG